MAMTVELPALERTDADRPASPAPSARLRYLARPALGLLLPVGLALGWEIVVWLGLSSGRLVPPPSKLFATLKELAESGALRPVIDRSYMLDEIVEAHRYVDLGHKKGNVIVSISPR